MIIQNTSLSGLNIKDAYEFGIASATGGTITYVGNYAIHTFLANDTFTLISNYNANVEVLMVAGGVVYKTGVPLNTGSYTVTIGQGGTGGTSGLLTAASPGSNTTFSTYVAIGGGLGGSVQASNSSIVYSGGSGGGSVYTPQAYAGGNALQPTSSSGGLGNIGGIGNNDLYGAGGGGGAGSAGNNAGFAGIAYAGYGGGGTVNPIIGSTLGELSSGNYYIAAGGGGGGGNGALFSAGGLGGGGTGGISTGGFFKLAANASIQGSGSGGGGGGYGTYSGANGQSGCVIIRYKYKN